jgi:hypothetical protein
MAVMVVTPEEDQQRLEQAQQSLEQAQLAAEQAMALGDGAAVARLSEDYDAAEAHFERVREAAAKRAAARAAEAQAVSQILQIQRQIQRGLTDGEREQLAEILNQTGILQAQADIRRGTEDIGARIAAEGRETEELRVQLQLIQLRARHGDDVAAGLEAQVRTQEKLRTELEQTQAAANLDDQLQQIQLVTEFAGRESEEYLYQIELLKLKKSTNDQITDSLRDQARELARERSGQRFGAEQRQLEQQIVESRAMLGAGGRETSGIRVQRQIGQLRSRVHAGGEGQTGGHVFTAMQVDAAAAARPRARGRGVAGEDGRVARAACP